MPLYQHRPRRFRRLALTLRRNRVLTTRLLLLGFLFPFFLWIFVSALAAGSTNTFGLPYSLLSPAATTTGGLSSESQNQGHQPPPGPADSLLVPHHHATRRRRVQNILLVTAHPDDEALFFGPTILQLTRQRHPKVKVSLLVLSSGNHKHLGRVRAQEQKASCAVLGIANCEVLDLPGLQDDPNADWPEELIQETVREWVRRWVVDAIITFDEGGVSGHRNHISVGNAIRADPPVTTIYTLTTTNVLRKYSSLLDFPLTLVSYLWSSWTSGAHAPHPHHPPHGHDRVHNHDPHPPPPGEEGRRGGGKAALTVSNLHSWRLNVRAFRQHASQNSWDRGVYAVLSRYMWFNGLVLRDED